MGGLLDTVNAVGGIGAVAIALGALLATPRRATVRRLREEVEVLRGFVATLTGRLDASLQENRELRRAARARPRSRETR